MEFEQILIQINEIFHKSIAQYKQEVIGKSDFSDVTMSQLFYLEAIYQLDSPTLSELANYLKVSKASATAGVQKLVKRGLAEKVQSSADQRVYYVHLSNDGLRLIEAEVHALSDFGNNITQSLSESEVRQLMAIFQKIIARYRS